MLPQYPGGECGGFLGGGPGVADQAVVASGGRHSRRVIHRAAGQQVVARPGHVVDDANGLLAGAAGLVSTDPGYAIVAALLLHYFEGGYGVFPARGQRGAQGLAFGDFPPAGLLPSDVSHLLGDRSASPFRAVVVDPRLQDAIGDQVVELRVRALDDQRR